MQITESFKNKVIRIFGEEGKAWIGDLPRVLKACIDKWQLTNCSLSEDMSMHLICFAEAPEFGRVALKLGIPRRELNNEIRVLSMFDGRHMCKCYASDESLGALLLEQILPGLQLTSVTDYKERITIAADLISKVPIDVPKAHKLPYYADWLNKAFRRARTENKVGKEMLIYIDKAEKYFCELEALGMPKVVLHGDLHHENMLVDNRGIWKAIDPQGVIGVKYQETARYIQNELWHVPQDKRYKYLDEVITIISNKTGAHKRIIALCTFILQILSICWSYEDYILPDEINEEIEDCDIYLKYINNLGG